MDHGKMFGLLPECDPAPPSERAGLLDRIADYVDTPRGARMFHRACIALVIGWAAVVIYGGVTLARAIGEAMR